MHWLLIELNITTGETTDDTTSDKELTVVLSIWDNEFVVSWRLETNTGRSKKVFSRMQGICEITYRVLIFKFKPL